MGTKTFMANSQTHTPKWHVIDADGKVLGRVAAEAASILRGKHTPRYTPHANCGDYVIIINAAKVVLTGRKLEQKEYIRHTGWIGGLKRVKYSELMDKRPEFAMELAIKGMLPHTTLGRECFRKLRVYSGAEHKHEAQIAASENPINTADSTNLKVKPAKRTAAKKTNISALGNNKATKTINKNVSDGAAKNSGKPEKVKSTSASAKKADTASEKTTKTVAKSAEKVDKTSVAKPSVKSKSTEKAADTTKKAVKPAKENVKDAPAKKTKNSAENKSTKATANEEVGNE